MATASQDLPPPPSASAIPPPPPSPPSASASKSSASKSSAPALAQPQTLAPPSSSSPPPSQSPKLTLEKIIGQTTQTNTALALNPQTHELAYSSGSVLILYNPKKNKQVRFFRASQTVGCCCFSSDGLYLAIGEIGVHTDPAVVIWCLKTGGVVSELIGHKFGVSCLAFSPASSSNGGGGGGILVSAGIKKDKRMYIWNWKAGRAIAAARLHGRVYSVKFTGGGSGSGSGKQFVTVGERHVKFWNLDASCISFPDDDKGGEGEGDSMSNSYSVLRKNLPNNAQLPEIKGLPASILQSHSTCTFVDCVCSTSASTSRVYTLTTSGALCSFDCGMLVMENWIDLDADVNTLTPGGAGGGGCCLDLSNGVLGVGCMHGVVRLFKEGSLEYIMSLPLPPSMSDCNATKPGQVSSLSPSLSTSTATATGTSSLPSAKCIRFLPSAKKVCVIYSDSSLFIYDISDVNNISKYRSFLAHSGGIEGLCVLPNSNSNSSANGEKEGEKMTRKSMPENTFVTAARDCTVRFWNLGYAADRALVERARNLFSRDMMLLVDTSAPTVTTATLNTSTNTSTNINTTTPASVASIPANANMDARDYPQVIQPHPNGNEIAIGTRFGKVLIYNVSEGVYTCIVKPDHVDSDDGTGSGVTSTQSSGVECLAYTSIPLPIPMNNGKNATHFQPCYLATSTNNLINIYNATSNYNKVCTLNWHDATTTVTSLKFTCSTSASASGSGRSRSRSSNGGNYVRKVKLISCSSDGNVYITNVDCSNADANADDVKFVKGGNIKTTPAGSVNGNGNGHGNGNGGANSANSGVDIDVDVTGKFMITTSCVSVSSSVSSGGGGNGSGSDKNKNKFNIYNLDTGRKVRNYDNPSSDSNNNNSPESNNNNNKDNDYNSNAAKGSLSEAWSSSKITFCPSGIFVATSGGGDKYIRLWDFYSGVMLGRVCGHSPPSSSSGDGSGDEVASSASSLSTNSNSTNTLSSTILKFTQDGKRLISTSNDGCIFVWRLAPEITRAVEERRAEIVSELNESDGDVDVDLELKSAASEGLESESVVASKASESASVAKVSTSSAWAKRATPEAVLVDRSVADADEVGGDESDEDDEIPPPPPDSPDSPQEHGNEHGNERVDYEDDFDSNDDDDDDDDSKYKPPILHKTDYNKSPIVTTSPARSKVSLLKDEDAAGGRGANNDIDQDDEEYADLTEIQEDPTESNVFYTSLDVASSGSNNTFADIFKVQRVVVDDGSASASASGALVGNGNGNRSKSKSDGSSVGASEGDDSVVYQKYVNTIAESLRSSNNPGGIDIEAVSGDGDDDDDDDEGEGEGEDFKELSVIRGSLSNDYMNLRKSESTSTESTLTATNDNDNPPSKTLKQERDAIKLITTAKRRQTTDAINSMRDQLKSMGIMSSMELEGGFEFGSISNGEGQEGVGGGKAGIGDRSKTATATPINTSTKNNVVNSTKAAKAPSLTVATNDDETNETAENGLFLSPNDTDGSLAGLSFSRTGETNAADLDLAESDNSRSQSQSFTINIAASIASKASTASDSPSNLKRSKSSDALNEGFVVLSNSQSESLGSSLYPSSSWNSASAALASIDLDNHNGGEDGVDMAGQQQPIKASLSSPSSSSSPSRTTKTKKKMTLNDIESANNDTPQRDVTNLNTNTNKSSTNSPFNSTASLQLKRPKSAYTQSLSDFNKAMTNAVEMYRELLDHSQSQLMQSQSQSVGLFQSQSQPQGGPAAAEEGYGEGDGDGDLDVNDSISTSTFNNTLSESHDLLNSFRDSFADLQGRMAMAFTSSNSNGNRSSGHDQFCSSYQTANSAATFDGVMPKISEDHPALYNTTARPSTSHSTGRPMSSGIHGTGTITRPVTAGVSLGTKSEAEVLDSVLERHADRLVLIMEERMVARELGRSKVEE